MFDPGVPKNYLNFEKHHQTTLSMKNYCKTLMFGGIVRPANRDWACQTERCHTLSNKTSLQ